MTVFASEFIYKCYSTSSIVSESTNQHRRWKYSLTRIGTRAKIL